ncbi:hypothetical protein [Singulisphaera acidiphila]|uniref:Uncharacterized protein n=1 Tax=Singulisphaera acidiphila (strain ATCC BAA-1392 / DSM 18658 / VKM B-2454 / MOB10) TaxID=886293 RepID=L0DB09_SINAD|nr:hypothetical protein [Singulisphaera acidiphila]AGA25851.1 hypothetical protein Sinac_1470 [Singulisphaera acidiphila DSM 18658]
MRPEGHKGQNRPPSLPFSGKKSYWEHQIDFRRHLLFRTAATLVTVQATIAGHYQPFGRI